MPEGRAAAVTATNGWVCSNCKVEQTEDSTYCQVCQFARPLDRYGIPQIFSGYFVHFNGIIPRTLIHPSHAVEWRMAERHGATCCTTFDPSVVNIIVYRPGYERSEKCRICIERYSSVSCVPIGWMLDSLLQSRQIHPSLYRLTSVPAVANATVRGTNLPHHHHPFYQINKREYMIATSFPAPETKVAKVTKVKEDAPPTDMEVTTDMGGILPPFFDLQQPQYTVVDVYDAVVACATGMSADTGDDENDKMEVRKTKAGIELISSQQSYNRVNRALFTGMNVVLSPSLTEQKPLLMAIERCGGKITENRGSLEETVQSGVTHVIYHHGDKKDEIMVEAAHLIATTTPGLQLAQSNWLEDCLILGEVLPLQGMYTPTPKLLETLSKKYAKANN
ncbi:hypothetical protein, conserved [Leishmania lindenbergi]|uniref:BRCT domain-containing protein n=1 Tax=Leishmania lindenbergi TaxID=651832 RepID=A0AAW2ZXR3_9TRYP